MYSNNFPNQKLTTKEKIEKYGSVDKWGENMIMSILQMSGRYNSYYRTILLNKKVNYDLYKGQIHEEDYKYVLKPYGLDVDYEFPAKLQHFDAVIKPKVDILVGEEIKRPFTFKAIQVNNEAVSQVEETKMEMILQMLQNDLLQAMQQKGLPANPDPNAPQTPEEVEQYVTHTYSDLREIMANNALNYLVKDLNLNYWFNEGFREMLITGEEIYWTGIVNNEPVCRLVNPLYFQYDVSPDSPFIEDAAWAIEGRLMTSSDVYDEYFEYLTEAQVEEIENLKGGLMRRTTMDTGIMMPLMLFSGLDGQPYIRYNSTTFIEVIRVEWRSLRKVGFLTYIDEMGTPQERMVDEDYVFDKKTGDLEIEWKWINEVWEGTRIGPDIYVNMRPKPNQYRNMDNPSKCKLSYTGIAFNNRNSRPISLVETLKPIQYLYNIIMYRLELEIARAKGKKLIMDVAQIPRSHGIDITKWMYYLDAAGIAFINSFEEGQGRFAGQKPQFNQFTEVDLSLSNVVGQYINILAHLERIAGLLTGINEQRQGQVQTSELVGNVERALMQSSYITEHYFSAHNEVKKRTLTNLLEAAKLAWLNGKKIQYIGDDMMRVFFSIDGDQFNDAEYGVFLSNSSRDYEVLNNLRQHLEMAVQAGTVQLKDVVAVLQSDSITKAQKVLEKAYQQMQESQQQAQQAEQQGAMQQIEAQEASKEKDRELKKYEIDENNKNKIMVAQITGISFNENDDINNNNVPDVLEVEKFLAEQQNTNKEFSLREKELSSDKEEKEKDRKHEKELFDREAKLKREEMESKEKIARNKPKPKK